MSRLVLAALALAIPPAWAGSPPAVDGPEDARPIRHWDVEHTALDVVVDLRARRIEGRVVHRVVPRGIPSDRWVLDQVGLDLGEVTVDGAPVSVQVGDTSVTVPLAPDGAHEVALAWSARPETGVHFRDPAHSPYGRWDAWTQGEGEDHRHWFPAVDHPDDRFTAEIALTVEDGFHAVANGRLVGSAPAEGRPGWTTWRYAFDHELVNYLIAFAVGEYAVHPVDGRIPFEVLAPIDVPAAQALFGADRAPAMMAYLDELLGTPYPYGVYRQVWVQDFLYGGMENTTLTILAHERTLGAQDVHGDRTEGLIAHELAHQWFGDLLTCHGWRPLWLNEGFATYYASRWEEHRHGAAAHAEDVRRWAGAARGTHRPMAATGWSKVDDRPNTDVYTRGATVLHMLRVMLGDATFDDAIAEYVATHADTLVESDDLRRVLERHGNLSLGWFFDRWVHGWGAPTLSSRWKAADGAVTVTLRQSGTPAYEGPVEVLAAIGDGPPTRRTVWLSPDTTRLTLPADGDVRWIAVDPRGGVLAAWTHEQPTGAWAAQAAEAPDAFARLEAIEQLGRVEGDQDAAATALADLLPEDATAERAPIARAAAAALGALGTEAARDALLAALDADHAPRVRRAVLRALGGFPLDEVVARRLARAVQDEAFPDLRGTALEALAEVRPSRAVGLGRETLGRPDRSTAGDAHGAAIRVLRAHGEASDAALLRRFLADDRKGIRRAAGWAAVHLALQADDDRVPARLVDPLVDWLNHPDQRTRRAAVGLLSSLGQDAAVPALQAFRKRTRLEGHRDAADEAIRTLRATRSAPRDPDAVLEAQAQLEALEARLETLQERLDALERR